MRRAILLAVVLIAGCEATQSPTDKIADPGRDYNPVSLRLSRRDVLTVTDGEVRAMAFSPGGRLLAVAETLEGGLGGALSLWDVNSRRRLLRTETPAVCSRLAFTPDSDKLVAMSRGSIDILRVSSMEKIRGIERPQRSWTDIDLSPDGKLLAAVAWEDSNVHVFELSDGERLRQLTGDFSAVAFGPAGKTLAAAGTRAVHVFDTETWQQKRLPTPAVLRAGPPIPMMVVLLGPEADYVFTAGASGRTWNVADGEQLGMLEPPPTIRAVAMSPDRRVVAVAENDLSLWELPQGRQLQAVAEHEGGPTTVAFSPDGETLATSGLADRRLILWDVRIR